MKQIYKMLCVVIVTVFLNGTLLSNDTHSYVQDETYFYNGNAGREFIIAIPPNDDQLAQRESLEMYISSAFAANVKIKMPGAQGSLSTKIKPGEVKTFSTFNGGMDWSLEVWEDESPVEKAIEITSDAPVNVYVLNSKSASSDGYMAIPVSNFGTDYIHCSYYDFHENRKWAGGFLIIGTHDNTEARIFLKGRGGQYDKTAGGKEIGKNYLVKLDKGEVYMIRGGGNTQATFDLTGSRVTSDKPVGLISFHNRTTLPKSNASSRDHLSEMIPPTTAWGKEYYSLALNRKINMGDLFRVVALEEDTDVDIRWYDLHNKQQIDKRNFILEKSGDFHDILETDHRWPHSNPSIRGTSVFKADKPILVMQYSYSVSWDGDSNYDPFMFLVTAKEQYNYSTIFQTPVQLGFKKNYVNIIAIGDVTDPTRADIKSIKLDGEPVFELIPYFPFNQIPGTDLFWARVEIAMGPHILEGNTKFGAYVYGYKSVDSYGWPAAFSSNLITDDKNMPQDFTEDMGNNQYKVIITDEGSEFTKNVFVRDTQNVQLYYDESPSFWPPKDTLIINVEVLDLTKEAYLEYYAVDRAGNVHNSKELFTKGKPFVIDLVKPEPDQVFESDTVKFNWLCSDESINTFNLLIAKDEEFTQTSIDTTTGDAEIDLTLADGLYYWKAGSDTVWSGTRSFVVNADERPDLIYPVNFASIESMNPVFKWYSPNLTKFVIEIVAMQNQNDVLYLKDTVTVMEYKPAFYKAGMYKWRVKSLEPVETEWSDYESFAVEVFKAPEIPDLLMPQNNKNVESEMTFIWSSSGMGEYEFQLAKDESFSILEHSDITKDTSLTITLENDDYFWKVRSKSEFAESPWSQVWRVLNTTGMLQNPEEISMRISPNPANEIIRISFNVDAASRIEGQVLDIQGNRIKEIIAKNKYSGNYSEEIGLGDMPSGNYFLKLSIGDKHYMMKFTVQR
ncbi:MAG: T9SS type A sorting domain-containing protein [Candidatus Kapaibacterium sp.]